MKNIDLGEVFWKAIGVTLVVPFIGEAVVCIIDVVKSVAKAIKE